MASEYLALIIEDDAEVAKVYDTLLSRFCQTEMVDTISKAIARLGAKELRPINVVLLDLMLPNGEGLVLVHTLRDMFLTLPIIVVSGYEYEARAVTTAGAQDFLRKPHFTQQQLVDSVQKAIATAQIVERFGRLREIQKTFKQEVREVREGLHTTKSQVEACDACPIRKRSESCLTLTTNENVVVSATPTMKATHPLSLD